MKRDRREEPFTDAQKPVAQKSDDPNAGYPGLGHPEGTLLPKTPAGPAANEPDGDASGRPGSSTMKHVTAGDEVTPADAAAAAAAIPAGHVRVKAKKTVLHGGMAYTEGQTFTLDEKEFDARKERDELERA